MRLFLESDADRDNATRVQIIRSYYRNLVVTTLVNFVLSKFDNAKDCDVMPSIAATVASSCDQAWLTWTHILGKSLMKE